MGDFQASHVSFQRCIPESGCLTGFNCQCVVFCLQPVQKYVVLFQLWRILPKLTLTLEDFTRYGPTSDFFSSMYFCQNNPALKILTPQTWLFWGPFALCVIQVRSPFQEGGSDQSPGNVGIYHRSGQFIRTFPAELVTPVPVGRKVFRNPAYPKNGLKAIRWRIW